MASNPEGELNSTFTELDFRSETFLALLEIVVFLERAPLRSSGTKYCIGLTSYFRQSHAQGGTR